MSTTTPREGDIYEVVYVGGHCFTIRYGYYKDSERDSTDPIPIYPCFISDPHYTEDGFPLITRIQDACEHYNTGNGYEGDGWCADCLHCSGDQGEIGICQCEHRRRIGLDNATQQLQNPVSGNTHPAM